MEAHQLRRLAVMAHVDPRTVAKALAGHCVKGSAGERIRDALASLQIALPPVAKGNAQPAPSDPPERKDNT